MVYATCNAINFDSWHSFWITFNCHQFYFVLYVRHCSGIPLRWICPVMFGSRPLDVYAVLRTWPLRSNWNVWVNAWLLACAPQVSVFKQFFSFAGQHEPWVSVSFLFGIDQKKEYWNSLWQSFVVNFFFDSILAFHLWTKTWRQSHRPMFLQINFISRLKATTSGIFLLFDFLAFACLTK